MRRDWVAIRMVRDVDLGPSFQSKTMNRHPGESIPLLIKRRLYGGWTMKRAPTTATNPARKAPCLHESYMPRSKHSSTPSGRMPLTAPDVAAMPAHIATPHGTCLGAAAITAHSLRGSLPAGQGPASHYITSCSHCQLLNTIPPAQNLLLTAAAALLQLHQGSDRAAPCR